MQPSERVDVKGVAARLSEMGIGVFMVLHDVPSKTLTIWVQIPGSTMADLKFKWAAVATALSESPGGDHIDIGTCDASPLLGTDGRGRIGIMRVRVPIENARELATSRRLRQDFWQHASLFVIEPDVDNTGFQQWVKVPVSAPTDIEGLESHPISVYVNMDSTYAALRLLGISIGFVIKEDPKRFRIKVAGLGHERQRLASKPVVEINDSNTFASTYTKGSPLKKRT